MLQVEVPLNHLPPSKSTLLSLATLWVNILLRKAVKIKHLSWTYVLRILNGEAASITFDELFKMSIQSSREDVATQVFSSVLQNESLQHELFNFLKTFAKICIAKVGVLPLQHLELTISSDIMETSTRMMQRGMDIYTSLHLKPLNQETLIVSLPFEL